MKKYSYLLSIALVLMAASSVYATNSSGGSTNTTGQGRTTVVTSPSQPPTTGNAVQNRNQIQTQNAGEETQLQVENAENEQLQDKTGTGSGNRSAVAIEHMSEVAKQVQILLETKTKGGIGDRVRLIAREQNQAQTHVEDQLTRLEKRSAFKTALFGPDYKAITSIKAIIEENKVRIEELQEVMTQLVNQSDITAVQETIQALEQENIALQDLVDAGEQTRSVFGWLIRLFVK